jgi:hypothetical protein
VLNGNRKPTKEKHAGHTPSKKPRTEPMNPEAECEFVFVLHVVHLCCEYKYIDIKSPNNIEKTIYKKELRGF